MSPKPAFVDPVQLRTVAYANSSNLMNRAQIYRFMVPRLDFVDWSLSHLPCGLEGRVLDVGCGPGRYLSRGHRMVGTDASVGMLREAREAARDSMLAAGDVQALPFPHSTFDVIVCIHMLYQTADICMAAAEMASVLKDDGVTLVATNGRDHVKEMDALVERTHDRSSMRFSLENGAALLESAFVVDGPHRMEARLEVTDPEAVVAYIESTRTLRRTTAKWDHAMASIRDRVSADIEDHGSFRVTVAPGVFVCKPRRRSA